MKLKLNMRVFLHILNARNSNNISSLQCYSVLNDIWVKIDLCIPLERGSIVLSTVSAYHKCNTFFYWLERHHVKVAIRQ